MIFRIIAQSSVAGTERQSEHLLESYCVLTSCPCQDWSFTSTAVHHADVCGKALGAWWLGPCSTQWTQKAERAWVLGRDTVLRKAVETSLGHGAMGNLPPSHGSGICHSSRFTEVICVFLSPTDSHDLLWGRALARMWTHSLINRRTTYDGIGCGLGRVLKNMH